MRLPVARHRPAGVLLALFAFLTLITTLLIGTLMLVKSSARAFLHDENLWSRHLQSAVLHADRFAAGGMPEDLASARAALAAPRADTEARQALSHSPPDFETARHDLLAAGNSPKTSERIIWLHRYFAHAPFIGDALTLWRGRGPDLAVLDDIIQRLPAARSGPDDTDLTRLRKALSRFESSLSPITAEFSRHWQAVENVTRVALVVAGSMTLASLFLFCGIAILMLRRALYRAEGKFHLAFQQAAIGMAEVSPSGCFVEVNDALCQLLQYPRHELIGNPVSRFTHPDDRASNDLILHSLLDGRRDSETLEKRYIRQDGETLWTHLTVSAVRDRGARPPRLFSVIEDITHARQLSDELSYRASHDSLTGLLNRQEIEQHLQQAIQTARSHDCHHMLAFIDLDQFKVINDTCGHIAGDHMLCQVAQVLRNHMREHDVLARLGGDEFAALFYDTSSEGARLATGKLHQAIEEYSFHWNGRTFSLSSSIGLATIGPLTPDSTWVLQAADTACNMAKDSGRARIHLYEEQDSALAHQRREMEWVSGIRGALDDDRLSLNAQLIVSTRRGLGHRFEVTLCLIDETGTTHPPGAFLPAAERYNLVAELDQFVLSRTLDLLARHRDALSRFAACHINLSASSITSPAFREEVTRLLEHSGVPGSRICFEITETAAVTSLHDALSFIDAVRQLGCQVSLDDFGSGLSSFGYLKTLPVDLLKIDGTFVRDIDSDSQNRAIVEAINHVARSLDKTTIAEYVENRDAIPVLRALGVDYLQGYAIHRPEPLEVLLRRLASASSDDRPTDQLAAPSTI